MAYSDFDKLKAFFFELKNAKFRPEKMRSRFVMNGGWATVNKAECFDLLRKKIPDLRGKDDAFLIKYLSNPNNIKNRVLAGFVAGERIELEKSLAEPTGAEVVSGQAISAEQAAPVGTTTSASAGGMPFGIPSAPSISSPSISSMPRAPRIVIRNVPQAPEPPKPDIAIANKSGVVVEKPTPGAKIITNREAVSEAGNLIQETPPSKIFIASSRGDIVREQPIKGPSRFSNLRSNVGSKIGKGINAGLERANPFLKRAGNSLVNGLTNIASLGGAGGTGGGTGSFFGRFGRGGRGGGTAGGGSLAGKAKGRGGLIFAGSIIGLMLLTGVLTITGTTPTGEAAPISPSNRTPGLDYAISFRDTTITVTNPEGIKAQVKNNWPDAQLQNWDTIVLQSIANGWNPAFILALWIEETGAQGKTPYDDPLGCAPDPNKPNSDIDISLGCLFRSFPITEYSNDKFADFMCMYSESKKAPCVFQTNPNFPKNIKYWYSQLVPSGSGALVPVSSVPPPPTDGNYAGWVKTNFNIDVSALPDSYQQWTYEILSTSAKADIAPKFKDLISRSLTKVVLTPGDEGSHTSGDTVYIRPGYDVNFFKQIFTHELGHRIKGTAGTTSPACNGQTIEQIESEGYLTYYAEHATPAQVRTPACGDNDQITRSDEDFGESVSYYINNEMGELNYGSGCSTYNSINPYARGDRPAHKAYIQCLLGP